MFPICNIPLIEYTLEFLAASEIQQIILVSSYLTNMLESYVRASRWNTPQQSQLRPQHAAHLRDTQRIRIINTEKTSTFGDTMRYLDAHKIVEGEFVLCVGGVIANANLDALVELHRYACAYFAAVKASLPSSPLSLPLARSVVSLAPASFRPTPRPPPLRGIQTCGTPLSAHPCAHFPGSSHPRLLPFRDMLLRLA